MAQTAVATRTLGSVLAGLRVAAQLRQKDLAEKLAPFGEDRVSNIETDKSPVSVSTFIQWCNACGVAPSDVIRTVPGF